MPNAPPSLPTIVNGIAWVPANAPVVFWRSRRESESSSSVSVPVVGAEVTACTVTVPPVGFGAVVAACAIEPVSVLTMETGVVEDVAALVTL